MTLLLDTTVLAYAAGDPAHPLADAARTIVRRASRTPGIATTTPEVIQEFLHVRTRRQGRANATDMAKAYLDLLTPLVLVTDVDARTALEVFADHPKLGAFDSFLAAVALNRDDLELVSADRGFATHRELPYLSLRDAARRIE